MVAPAPAAMQGLYVVATNNKVRKKIRQVGPEVGPTSAFYSCFPTGMHGPTFIFWAKLTHFSRQPTVLIMDEATASIDFATDQRIQHATCVLFGETTVCPRRASTIFYKNPYRLC